MLLPSSAEVDRMIGQFGVAAMSIAAFQTILFTYLGVNFVLTTGMHSYGMGDSPVVMWMLITAVAELAVLAWGGWPSGRTARCSRAPRPSREAGH